MRVNGYARKVHIQMKMWQYVYKYQKVDSPFKGKGKKQSEMPSNDIFDQSTTVCNYVSSVVFAIQECRALCILLAGKQRRGRGWQRSRSAFITWTETEKWSSGTLQSTNTNTYERTLIDIHMHPAASIHFFLSSDKLQFLYSPCISLPVWGSASLFSHPLTPFTLLTLWCGISVPLSPPLSLSLWDEMWCINVTGTNTNVSEVSGSYYVVILREENI